LRIRQVFEVRPCGEHRSWLGRQNARTGQHACGCTCGDDRDSALESASIVGVGRNARAVWFYPVDRDSWFEPRTAVNGPPQNEVIKDESGHHERFVRPADFRRGCAAIGRDDLVRLDVEAVRTHLGQQAHAVQNTQRARGQAIAAGLVARERGAIHQQDVDSARAEKMGGSGSARPGTYDNDVMHVHHAIG